MGKSQKYTEDKLLEGVVKYSEVCKRKIKATELAKWCRDNIEGLENVRDYHFTRPIKERDEKSGKMKERPKSCTQRMMAINKSRSLVVGVNSNMLLRSSNIDTFFEQSKLAQKKMIVETRELFDKIMAKNTNLERTNEALRSENMKQKKSIAEISQKVDRLQKAQIKLTKQVNYLMKVADEKSRKEALCKMGICDGLLDLDLYVESLQQSLNEVMNINKILGEYISDNECSRKEECSEYESGEENKGLVEEIFSGLDFD